MKYLITVITAAMLLAGTFQIISYLGFRTVNFFKPTVAEFVVQQLVNCNGNKCNALISLTSSVTELSILIPVDSTEVHVGQKLKVSR